MAQKLDEIAEGIDSEEQDEYKNQGGEDDKPDDWPLDLWVDMNTELSKNSEKILSGTSSLCVQC